MGNIIVSSSFVDVASANITTRTASTGYDAINVMDRWNLKQRFRAGDANTNDWLMKFYFGGVQTIVGILLYDVNFSKVKIQGHGADSWGGSLDYAGTDLTVSQNAITGRYQIYIPLTAFTPTYSRIFIPSGTAAVSGYTTKWEIGAVCFLSSVTTLVHNVSYGYEQTGKHFYKTSVNERIQTGEEIRWQGRLPFGNRSTANEAELWALNRMNMAQPFVYYENGSDTSAAYLCIRDDAVAITQFTYGGVTGNSIAIKEVYKIGED